MTEVSGEPGEGESDAARLQEVLAALQAFQSASAGGGAIRLNRRGVVAAVDEPVAKGLGLTLDEIIGAPLTELVGQGDRRRLTAALEACFDGGTAGRLDLELIGAAGSAVAVSLGMAPLLKDGAVDGIVVAVTRAASGDAVEIW